MLLYIYAKLVYAEHRTKIKVFKDSVHGNTFKISKGTIQFNSILKT
jgi:hypothetical protein